MKVEKCSNCGYHLTFGEAMELLARKKGGPQESLEINAFLNVTNVKCPICGSVGHWSNEDEFVDLPMAQAKVEGNIEMT